VFGAAMAGAGVPSVDVAHVLRAATPAMIAGHACELVLVLVQGLTLANDGADGRPRQRNGPVAVDEEIADY